MTPDQRMMHTVHVQDFQGNWTTKTVASKQEAFDFITSLDVVRAVEIEGVEQESLIISFEELENWLTQKELP